MTQNPTLREQPESEHVEQKPFAAPIVRRHARLAVVTAGSFDLVIPNA